MGHAIGGGFLKATTKEAMKKVLLMLVSSQNIM